MYQYLGATGEHQPWLYVFKRVFKVEENLDFERYLCKFDMNYDDWQQKSFQEFWYQNGDNIILHKYCREIAENPQLEYSDEGTHNYTEAGDKCEETNQLWQKYCENIYAEEYQAYVCIFYEYYQNLYQSLRESIVSEENLKGGQSPLDAESFVDDFKKLQLLGLPTAFGREQYSGGRSKRDQKLEHSYCGFPTDEEIMDVEKDTSLIEKNKRDQKKKNRKLRRVPEFLKKKGMIKYWRKRFSLFSRYDDGIRLDCESWFSVTPEQIAIHLANRLSCDIIIDAFCGCGGNAIQFARTCKRVVAIDIDPLKLNMAKHNASIYGVADKIDFVNGDFLQMASSGRFRGNIVFLSPPWGGPEYKRMVYYDIERFLRPSCATELMEISRKISENVVFYLPRNTSIDQVVKLAGIGKRCELEHNYIDSRLVAITALYGEDIIKET